MHKSNESSFIANINTLAEQVTLLRKMEGILSGDVLKSLHRIANKDYGYLIYDLSKGVTREGCRKIDINLSKNSKKELRHVKYNRVGVKGAGSCDYTWIELENPTGKVHEILQAIHESIDKHNENTTTIAGRIENVELDLLTTAEGFIIRIKDKCDITNLQSVALVVDSLYVENALESRLEVSWYTTTSSILSTICTLKSIQKEKVELEIAYEEVYATISAIENKVGADRDVIEDILERVINNFKELGYTYVGDYAAGVELTEYNQIVREGGEFWRASGTTTLPYTLTGAGVDEGGALVSVGDANLRQQLQREDGSSMVVHGEHTVHDYLAGINNPADKSSYTELDGYDSIQNDKWNYNIGASDERFRMLNSGSTGGIKPIQPYIANAVISFADFRTFPTVRVPVQVVSGAALLPINDITASTFESPAIYCPFFHYNFYAQARNTFKYIGSTPLSVVMYGQFKIRIRVSDTNCEDVRASGNSELLAPTSILSIRQVNAKGDPVEYKDYGLDIVYNRRDTEIYKIDPLENSNNAPGLSDSELFVLLAKDPSGFDNVQFESVAGYGIAPNTTSEELVKYRDGDKTTEWIPTKGYTKFLVKRVSGSPWRLQYKDQYGRIYYDSASSLGAKPDEEMVYNIPSKARYLRVYYSGHTDTSDMLSIHALNGKYDMSYGSWCTVEFNVCTHQTFEPNGEYQFIVQNFDGPRNIALTPNGIQVDSAAIFFSFNYNDYLVNMGELKW